MGAGVLDGLDVAVAAFASVRDADLRDLVEPDLFDTARAVNLLRCQAEAFQARLLAEMDTRRVTYPSGAQNAASWSAWQLPIPIEHARRLAKVGRKLAAMPLAAAAYRDGLITTEHMKLLADCQRTSPALFDRDEALLLGHAVELDVVMFRRAAKYWCQHADPDGSLSDAEKQFLKRKGSLVNAPDGMELLAAQLDPIGGAIFRETWEILKQELFDEDWAKAKETYGDDTCAEHLERTDAQRGADALRLMAERARLVNAKGKVARKLGKRPLFTVVVGSDSLATICETDRGTVLDPHLLLPEFDRAEFERVVFGPDSTVIDVGLRERFFTGGTRRAVEVTHGECAHPSCHAPVSVAHIHHITHYEDGGLTVQENGIPYCPWHHRWEHSEHGGTGGSDRPAPPVP